LTLAHAALRALTDLGNLYVIVPVALVIAIWALWARGWRAAVRIWVLWLGLVLVVLGLKYAAWSDWGRVAGVIRAQYRGAPSGHAALAGFVYGLIAMFAWRSADRRLGVAGGWMFGALAVAVGCSRVALGEHPVVEVIGGLLCASPFLWLARPAVFGHRLGGEAVLLYATAAVAVLAELSDLRFHEEQRFFLYLQSRL